MFAAPAQDIFGHDRNDRAEDIRPIEGRADEDPDTNSRDIGAGEVRPFAEHPAREDHLRDDGRGDGGTCAGPAFEHAERELPEQEDARDEDWRQIPVLESKVSLPRSLLGWRLRGRRGRWEFKCVH